MHVSYEELIAYAADETGPSKSAEISAHVTVCSQCAATVINYGVAGNAIRMTVGDTPSPAVLARVYALFPSETQPQRGWLGALSDLFAFPERRAAFAIAITILVLANLCLLGGGTVAYSQNSVTGEMLYPIKTTAENVRLFFALTDSGRVIEQTGLAGERVREIGMLADRQRYDGIPSTTTAYKTHVKGAMDALLAVYKQNVAEGQRLAGVVNQKLNEYTKTMETVAARLPVDLSPSLAASIQSSLSSAIDTSQSTLNTLVQWETNPPGSATAVPTGSPVPSGAATKSPVPAGSKTVASPTATSQTAPTSQQPVTVPTTVPNQTGPTSGVAQPTVTRTPTKAPVPPTVTRTPTKAPVQPTVTPTATQVPVQPTVTPTATDVPGHIRQTTTPTPKK